MTSGYNFDDINSFLTRKGYQITEEERSRMRKIEMQRRGPVDNINASFYRGGKTGEWKDLFTPEIREGFNRNAGKALILAGYE